MLKLKEQLAGMGLAVDKKDFSAMILSSLPEMYRPLITSILTTARILRNQLSSTDIIAHVTDEADNRTLSAQSRNESAMISKATVQEKRAERHCKYKCTNPNCTTKTGHTTEQCYAPGGGREGQWPKSKGKQKESQPKLQTTAPAPTNQIAANVVTNATASNDNKIYAFTVSAQSVDQAHRASHHEVQDAIIDCGATDYFCPDRSKFQSYPIIDPVPINAAKGDTMYAYGKGNMASTLISASQMDKAGYLLLI
ncbi:hypothetical protein SERLA73DRAFT_68447 [Serpula lacrymans var. lacrymans S7.3]|uniref:CCHC-type domain-containing protein n=1 Tax=Serpula lacrymans var. lacrymans (strain S7.3) TaxID=936435 RepID=F8PFW6_SERL3|nr:hypothetical protein SERLA73DRAFT_68447 [Serpula lacrymans var. lacrymans S7.3]